MTNKVKTIRKVRVGSRFLKPKSLGKKKKNKKETNDMRHRRSQAFYTDPSKGGKGVCVSRTRTARLVRKIRPSIAKEQQDLLGFGAKKESLRMAPSYVEKLSTGLDAYHGRLLKITKLFAQSRMGRSKSDTRPVSALVRDGEFAIEVVNLFCNQ